MSNERAGDAIKRIGIELAKINADRNTAYNAARVFQGELVEQLKRVRDSYGQDWNSMKSINEAVGQRLAKLHEEMGLNGLSTDYTKRIALTIASSWATVVKEIGENNKGLIESMQYTGERLPDAMKELGNSGWFFDYDFTPGIIVSLADKLLVEQKVEVDETMINYYEENIEEIFDHLNRRHPGRKHIFGEIFTCYKQDLFYVAIPTVFGQIDGICFELSGGGMFMTSNKKPNVFIEITKYKRSDSFLLSPIRQRPAVSYTEDYQIPGELNRHLVMHGKDTQYGNRLNFFKSLSLLKYLSDVLHFHRLENKLNKNC